LRFSLDQSSITSCSFKVDVVIDDVRPNKARKTMFNRKIHKNPRPMETPIPVPIATVIYMNALD